MAKLGAPVVMKRVNTKLKMRIKRVENCNYAVEMANELKLHTVNIGGLDICDGNKKLILGVVWQMMRLNLVQILSSLSSGGKLISDADMVRLARAYLCVKTAVLASFPCR